MKKILFSLTSTLLFTVILTQPVQALTHARLIRDNLLICSVAQGSACTYTPTGYGGTVTVENKLGIGIANPTFPLEVYGTDGTWLARFGSATNYLRLAPNEVQSINDALHLNTSSGNNVQLVGGGGNVGIGTTNPRFKLEYTGSILSTAAGNANVNMSGGQYTLGANRISADTSIYSYSRICSSNSYGDCTSTGGTVIYGGSTMIHGGGYLKFWNGVGLSGNGNSSYLYLYPNYPSVASSNSAIHPVSGNGVSAWVNDGYLGADSNGFGLWSNTGAWSLRIPLGTNDVINDYGAYGVTIGSGASPAGYRLYIVQDLVSYTTYYQPQLYADSPTTGLISQTAQTGSSYDNFIGLLNAGVTKWSIGLSTTGGDASSNNFQIVGNVTGSHELFCWFNANHDCYFYGPLRIAGASSRTVRTKASQSLDTWLRFVGDNDNGIHDLAVGSIYYNGGIKFDLAEVAPVNPDENLKLGEIVSIDDSADVRIVRSQSDEPNLISGIVSDTNTASLVIGGDLDPSAAYKTANRRPIALAGRVITYVNLDNGPIDIGDSITISKTAGTGTKATSEGKIISKAMEKFDGTRVNSAGVDKIIAELETALGKAKSDSSEEKSLQASLSSLRSELPNGTGRIITYIAKQHFVPDQQLALTNQVFENQKLIDELKFRLSKLNK